MGDHLLPPQAGALFKYFAEDKKGSVFEVRPTGGAGGGVGEGASVFAKVDIPEVPYVMPTHFAASFEV